MDPSTNQMMQGEAALWEVGRQLLSCEIRTDITVPCMVIVLEDHEGDGKVNETDVPSG